MPKLRCGFCGEVSHLSCSPPAGRPGPYSRVSHRFSAVLWAVARKPSSLPHQRGSIWPGREGPYHSECWVSQVSVPSLPSGREDGTSL